MIQVAGMPFQQNGMWPSGSIERIIVQRMHEDSAIYSYQSIDELLFELKLRKNIIVSARAMNEGQARFEIFENSRGNSKYWYLTDAGGFQLRDDVRPSDAIQDIFNNSSLYAFECATAKVIIYYHAVLNSIGEYLFNQLFQNLYLYSWHTILILEYSPFIRIISYLEMLSILIIRTVNPETSWWRGENAVSLGDGTYFGHGLGIGTAEQIIGALNKTRKPGSNQSAYLTNVVVRPSFKHLAKFSMPSRGYSADKIPHVVIHHNKSSISCNRYLFYLNQVYNQMTYLNPFP